MNFRFNELREQRNAESSGGADFTFSEFASLIY